MRRYIISSIVLLSSISGIYAQNANGSQQYNTEFNDQQRGDFGLNTVPTVYEMTDEVRNILGLDHNQFDKVYQAYDKFNTAIFGSSTTSDNRMGMPGGRPGGMHGGGPGGMGGPGGGMQGGAPGMQGGPGMNGAPMKEMDNQISKNQSKEKGPKPLSEKEIKKRQQKIDKQEQALAKKMAKILNDDTKYQQWLEIRHKQTERLFPPHIQDPH